MSSQNRYLDWIRERIPFLVTTEDFLRRKTVPRHRYTSLYMLGGLSLFLFLVQVTSGALLALYYSPTPDGAHESVRRITDEVEFGWLIRSIHIWGSHLMVGAVLAHMFTTYFMKAYRKPREIMWVSGVVMLFVVLGFAFTGYLLPWDTVAYFATQIGTEIPKSIPLMGNLIVTLLRGELDVGAEALRRMFSFHTIILPFFSLALITFHVMLQQSLGTSTPMHAEEKRPSIPFLPNFLYRDFLGWVACGATLLALALMLPAGLGEKADPYASAPIGIHPEWYFLPLYQTLRMFPATFLSLNGEMLVNVGVGLLAGFWVAVPFLDRRSARNQSSRTYTWVGVVLVAYSAIALILAYTT